jgi:FAD:protein FMN transferase
MSRLTHRVDLDVFGGSATIVVTGRAQDGTSPQLAAVRAAAALRRIHTALTRFETRSELSRLNADPRPAVAASPLLRRLARAVRDAGEASGGLVDGTVLPALEAAGYAASRAGQEAAPLAALVEASAREARPALPDEAAAWRDVYVDDARGTIVRPPGVRLDGGGLVKGIACDLLARRLARHAEYAVECAGDLRVGGAHARRRPILVSDPFGGAEPIAHFDLAHGAVATSGVVRRCWPGEHGTVAHHLIDPGRRAPAFTGLLQATAFAPTALEAEVRAKAALLAGPQAAAAHLPDGGVLVTATGEVLDVAAAGDVRGASGRAAA